MKKLFPLFMIFSLSASEVAHKHTHKDTVIVMHQSEDEQPGAPDNKCCSYGSKCDTRLKVAIITATVSVITAVASTTVAILYHC